MSSKSWPWSLGPAQWLQVATWGSVCSAPVSPLLIHWHVLPLQCLDFSPIHSSPSTLQHLHSPRCSNEQSWNYLNLFFFYLMSYIILLDLLLQHISNPNMYYFLLPRWSTMSSSLRDYYRSRLTRLLWARVHSWHPTSLHTMPEGSL